MVGEDWPYPSSTALTARMNYKLHLCVLTGLPYWKVHKVVRLSIYWITTCRAVRRPSLGLTLLLAVLFASIARADDPISAKIVSGDILRIVDRSYFFIGIDAAELGQICQRASGRDFDCGHIAKTALMDHTAGGTVKCTPVGPNDTCIVTDCRVDVFSLTHNMVHTGWAINTPQNSTGLRTTLNSNATVCGRDIAMFLRFGATG